MPEYPIILGVYSLKQESEIGLGETTSKCETVTYWFARQVDADNARAAGNAWASQTIQKWRLCNVKNLYRWPNERITWL